MLTTQPQHTATDTGRNDEICALFESGESVAEITKRYGISRARVYQIAARGRRKPDADKARMEREAIADRARETITDRARRDIEDAIHILDLENVETGCIMLSYRSERRLLAAGLVTVAQVMRADRKALRSIDGLGRKSLDEIRNACAGYISSARKRSILEAEAAMVRVLVDYDDPSRVAQHRAKRIMADLIEQGWRRCAP